MGTRFDSKYRLDAFDCGIRNNAFDVRGGVSVIAPPTTLNCVEAYIGVTDGFYKPASEAETSESGRTGVTNKNRATHHYDLYRGYLKTLSMPLGKYNTVQLHFDLYFSKFRGGDPFSLFFFKVDPWATPFVFANWAYTSLGTLLEIPYSDLSGWTYPSSKTYPLDKTLIVPGEDLYIMMVHSEDVSSTPPNLNDDESIGIDEATIIINT